jgi:hypothetical protein
MGTFPSGAYARLTDYCRASGAVFILTSQPSHVTGEALFIPREARHAR